MEKNNLSLADYLSLVLEIHGFVLESLCLDLGDQVFNEIMDRAQENDQFPEPHSILLSKQFENHLIPDPSEYPYEDLQRTVKELQLKGTSEFYLWSYPYYRLLIESSMDLNTEIDMQKDQLILHHLLEEVMGYEKNWVLSLGFPEEGQKILDEILSQAKVKLDHLSQKKLGIQHLRLV